MEELKGRGLKTRRPQIPPSKTPPPRAQLVATPRLRRLPMTPPKIQGLTLPRLRPRGRKLRPLAILTTRQRMMRPDRQPRLRPLETMAGLQMRPLHQLRLRELPTPLRLTGLARRAQLARPGLPRPRLLRPSPPRLSLPRPPALMRARLARTLAGFRSALRPLASDFVFRLGALDF